MSATHRSADNRLAREPWLFVNLGYTIQSSAPLTILADSGDNANKHIQSELPSPSITFSWAAPLQPSSLDGQQHQATYESPLVRSAVVDSTALTHDAVVMDAHDCEY
ncbi:hypothetical protein BS17DRAFT_812939 [Gyrodon lividus]|nr:hypothetical protein BS17DRAFT_812939 [Gyrodon lividus]